MLIRTMPPATVIICQLRQALFVRCVLCHYVYVQCAIGDYYIVRTMCIVLLAQALCYFVYILRVNKCVLVLSCWPRVHCLYINVKASFQLLVLSYMARGCMCIVFIHVKAICSLYFNYYVAVCTSAATFRTSVPCIVTCMLSLYVHCVVIRVRLSAYYCLSCLV